MGVFATLRPVPPIGASVQFATVGEVSDAVAKKEIYMARSLNVIFIIILFCFGCSSDNETSMQEDFHRPLVDDASFGESYHLLFLGDTSFGESYHNQRFLASRGYGSFLAKLTPLLNRADYVIANLETPITNLPTSPLAGKKLYIHWGDVHKTPQALKSHNIRAVSLANNHTLDYGIEGFRQTLKALERVGIEWFGGGLSESQAAEPLRHEFTLGSNRFQLVVAAGFEYQEHYEKAYNFYARKDDGGVNDWTTKKAMDQLRTIRQANPDAFVVAFPHWGQNYRLKTETQRQLAHALIDAGANLVIGHGAHILQEIENYRSRWILYSLGNFVFNSPGRYQKENADPFSLAARLDVSETEGILALRLRLYPVLSDNHVTNYQPRLVTQAELTQVKRNLLQHSPDSGRLQKALYVGEDKIGWFLALDVLAPE